MRTADPLSPVARRGPAAPQPAEQLRGKLCGHGFSCSGNVDHLDGHNRFDSAIAGFLWQIRDGFVNSDCCMLVRKIISVFLFFHTAAFATMNTPLYQTYPGIFAREHQNSQSKPSKAHFSGLVILNQTENGLSQPQNRYFPSCVVKPENLVESILSSRFKSTE